jgi:hypothetical protein
LSILFNGVGITVVVPPLGWSSAVTIVADGRAGQIPKRFAVPASGSRGVEAISAHRVLILILFGVRNGAWRSIIGLMSLSRHTFEIAQDWRQELRIL